MNVLIIGGEATGAQLAGFLLDQKINVCLVENRREVLIQLHQELPTETIYEDNPMDLQALEHAGIRDANVLVACTSSDADNVVLCYLAQTRYHVPRTIGRINNPRHAWLFTEKMHVDVALNESSILAHLIQEEMSLGDMMTLLKLRRGQIHWLRWSLHRMQKRRGSRSRIFRSRRNVSSWQFFEKARRLCRGGSRCWKWGMRFWRLRMRPANKYWQSYLRIKDQQLLYSLFPV